MKNIITCPSGLKGRIAPITVETAEKLTSQEIETEDILDECWLETLDTGPYQFEDKPDWKQLLAGDISTGLSGDMTAILIGVRALTFGSKYEFDVECTAEECIKKRKKNGKEGPAKIAWEIDLNELPIVELLPEVKEVLINGNRFETILPVSERKVVYRMLTAKDEVDFAASIEDKSKLSAFSLMRFRIVEIEGVDSANLDSVIKGLSVADATHLMDEFYNIDCGVESAIEVVCPACQSKRPVMLPFDERFFAPTKKGKTKRRVSKGLLRSSTQNNGSKRCS